MLWSRVSDSGAELREEAGRWLSEILERKASLKVAVYGSYYPTGELRRLERICDSLKSEGYVQTYLVKDLADLPDFRDDFDKSIFSLERSNVNLFILTFKGQKQGAVKELTTYSETLNMCSSVLSSSKQELLQVKSEEKGA